MEIADPGQYFHLPMIDVLRAAILAADPRITETEKWNSPNFAVDGADRVTLRINPKGGVQLVFHRGAKVRPDAADFRFDDPSGLLEWRAPDRGVLSVADEAEAVALSPQITQLLRRWIAAA